MECLYGDSISLAWISVKECTHRGLGGKGTMLTLLLLFGIGTSPLLHQKDIRAGRHYNLHHYLLKVKDLSVSELSD